MPFYHWPEWAGCTIVFAFVFGCQATDPVLFVLQESAFVAVTVCIQVFSFAIAFAVEVVSGVLVSVRVDCVSLSSVVSGRISGFALGVGELVRRSSFFFGHWSFRFIINEGEGDRFFKLRSFILVLLITQLNVVMVNAGLIFADILWGRLIASCSMSDVRLGNKWAWSR